jgi:acylglycerol lipase
MRRMIRNAIALLFVGLMAACAPLQQSALRLDAPVQAGFSEGHFTSFDGAKLGLSVWRPEAETGAGVEPDVVIIGVHGMNDYAGQFNEAGAWWAEQGAVVYAYDQRGHGRSPRPGIWAEHDVLREDMRTAVKAARARHPRAKIAVVGVSMGASVGITAFASDKPPEADAFIMSGPGLRGWGTLPWLYSVSLWTSAHVRPSWVVVPPKGVSVTPTDNTAKLRAMWADKNVLKDNRIDSVYGVVSIMEEADRAIDQLPAKVPSLLLYGAKDEVIPANGVERAAKRLPVHVRTAYYRNGYHMLLNDLQGEVVWRDILAFVRDPGAKLPSGAPGLPWGPRQKASQSAER